MIEYKVPKVVESEEASALVDNSIIDAVFKLLEIDPAEVSVIVIEPYDAESTRVEITRRKR